jgi:hypothetical protein
MRLSCLLFRNALNFLLDLVDKELYQIKIPFLLELRDCRNLKKKKSRLSSSFQHF